VEVLVRLLAERCPSRLLHFPNNPRSSVFPLSECRVNRDGAKSKVSPRCFSHHSIISRVIFPLSFQPPTPTAFAWTVNPSTTSRKRLFPTSPNCCTPSTAV
jgi:hypothetical protein